MRFRFWQYLAFSGLLTSWFPAILSAQQPNPIRLAIDPPPLHTDTDILKDCAFHQTTNRQLLFSCTAIHNYDEIILHYETTTQHSQIWSALFDASGHFLDKQMIVFDTDLDARLLVAFSPNRWVILKQVNNLSDKRLPGQSPDQTSVFVTPQGEISWQRLIWQFPDQTILAETLEPSVFLQDGFVDQNGHAITVGTDFANIETHPISNMFFLQAQDQNGQVIWQNRGEVEQLLLSSNPQSMAGGFVDSGDTVNKFILPRPQGGFVVYGPGNVPNKLTPVSLYGIFILCFGPDGGYQNGAFVPKLSSGAGRYVSMMPDGRLALFPFYDREEGGNGSQLAYLDADCRQESYQTMAPVRFPNHFETTSSSVSNHFMAVVTGANNHHYLLYRQYEWEDKPEEEVYWAKDQPPALYIQEIDEKGRLIRDYPVISPQDIANHNFYADRHVGKHISGYNYDLTLTHDQKFILISLNQMSLDIDENTQEYPPLLLYRLSIGSPE